MRISIVLLHTFLVCFTSLASAQDTSGLAETERGFGFKLISKLLPTVDSSGKEQSVKAEKNENLVVSPYGLFECLHFLHENTTGQAKSEIANALSFSAVGDLGAAAKALRRALKPSAGVPPLVGQNVLLFDAQYSLTGQAKSSLADSFLVESIAADWTNPSPAEKQVNDVFDLATSGRMKDFGYKAQGRQAGDVVFLNLCYFKDSWFKQFDEKLTRKETFHCADGTKLVHDFVQEKGRSGKWLEHEHFTLMEIPYKSSSHALGMVLVLPTPGVGARTVIEKLQEMNCLGKKASRPQWNSLAEKIDIKVPKFRIETDRSSMKEACLSLGVRSVFSVDSGLGKLFTSKPSLYVADIKQESFLQFDEKGTEAAAKTIVEMQVFGLPPKFQKPNKQFVADRPFMFFLVDHDGMMYFAGRIAKPVWSGSQKMSEQSNQKGGSSNKPNAVGKVQYDASSAQLDIAKGKLNLLGPPLPNPPWWARYSQLLNAKGIGQIVVYREGTALTEADQAYNSVMMTEIMRRHGVNILSELRSQAQQNPGQPMPWEHSTK